MSNFNYKLATIELQSTEVKQFMQPQPKKFRIREVSKKYNHVVDNWLGIPE